MGRAAGGGTYPTGRAGGRTPQGVLRAAGRTPQGVQRAAGRTLLAVLRGAVTDAFLRLGIAEGVVLAPPVGAAGRRPGPE